MIKKITLQQWEELMKLVDSHVNSANEKKDVLYRGCENSIYNKRFYCYDNYDRYYIPGLDFVLKEGKEKGMLTVYSGSEQSRAPITLEQGKQIARNMFNEYGGQMADEIVCEWVMEGNASVF